MLPKLITLVFLFLFFLDSIDGRSNTNKQKMLDEELANKFSQVAVDMESIIENLNEMSALVQSAKKGSGKMYDR